MYYYRPQLSCGKVMFYTYLSFCSQRGMLPHTPPCHACAPPPYMPPAMYISPCHACAPPPRLPPATHAPCHTHPPHLLIHSCNQTVVFIMEFSCEPIKDAQGTRCGSRGGPGGPGPPLDPRF